MTNDELTTTVETEVEDKKPNLEEEFKKLQEQVNELANNTKIKDELLAKAEKDRKDLETQYNLLADTHKLLKANIPVRKDENKIHEMFKNSLDDLKHLSLEDQKILYNTLKE